MTVKSFYPDDLPKIIFTSGFDTGKLYFLADDVLAYNNGFPFYIELSFDIQYMKQDILVNQVTAFTFAVNESKPSCNFEGT